MPTPDASHPGAPGSSGHVLDWVDDYVLGVLAPEDHERIERHVAQCEICQVALREARERQALLTSVPPLEASEELIQKTLRKVEDAPMNPDTSLRRRLRFAGRALSVFAVAAIVLGVTHLWFYSIKPPTFDLRILGQERLLSGASASIRVRAFDKGEPAADIPVRLALYDSSSNHRVELAAFTTNAQGTGSPVLDMPEWEPGDYELQVEADTGGTIEQLVAPVELIRSWKLMLSSDKPIYQPGQMVHLRSLALRRPDLKPVADSPVTFSVVNPKGNVIFRQEDQTSRFGIASADCQLITEIEPGRYQIVCDLEGIRSSQSIKVEKYVLPKFKTGIELDRSFYAPGETVHGSLQASYFFGQPVHKGRFDIQVQSVDTERFTIHKTQGELDEKGNVDFEFDIPDILFGRPWHTGSAGNPAVASFELVATITDAAGQNHSTLVSRQVTTFPIRLDVFSESKTVVRGVPNRIFILARYVDGRPAQVKMTISGRGESVLETDKLGMATYSLVPSEDRVGISVVATDADGLRGRRRIVLNSLAGQHDFLIRTDKAVYAGGDSLTLTALGHGVEPVFVDLLKDGQTLMTATIEMSDSKGQLVVDIPPHVFGTLELIAYRFERQGLPIRKSRLLYIGQPQQLQISTSLDRDEYQPGSSAKVQFAITDRDGKPVPGAVSVSMVDEAVYSLTGRHPGMEEAFFLVEQKILEPIATVYPWSPFNGPGVDFETALFARASKVTASESAIPEAFTGRGSPTFDEIDTSNEFTPGAIGSTSSFIHSLAGRTLPGRVYEVAAYRSEWLHNLTVSWVCLGLLFGLAAWVTTVVWLPKWPSVIFIGASVAGVILFMASLFFVSLSAFPGAVTDSEANWGAAGGTDTMEGAPPPTGAAGPGDAAPAAAAPNEEPQKRPASEAPLRVREWFPETLVWRPELITDDNGVATLDIDPLADSITTWRITSSAVSAQGQLGGAESALKVFQPFFVDVDVPATLTLGDRVGVPLVVYNYLDTPQTVTLDVKAADWFERLGNQVETLTLNLEPNEVRSLHVDLELTTVGRHPLEITARSGDVADGIRRMIEVVPGGRVVEEVVNGTLDQPTDIPIAVPANAIPGSGLATVKFYPSSFSQLVEGLDGLFQMPHGCFEQTTSTTYPNVLVLDYLRRSGQSIPELEAKARQYIHVGYQRLIGFEVSSGGFSLYGDDPGVATLTAYGLMEFEDMAQVHDVDQRMIDRTRRWLLRKREQDGSWSLGGGYNQWYQSQKHHGLCHSAFIARAVFAGANVNAAVARPTLDGLLSYEPDVIEDPYVLAMVTWAIAGIDPMHPALGQYAERLAGMAVPVIDAETELPRQFFWKRDGRTLFHGTGDGGNVETTALAVLVLMELDQAAGTARGAIDWLVSRRTGHGTCGSTQSTVLALKALVSAADVESESVERSLVVSMDGEAESIEITPEQFDVVQRRDYRLLADTDYQLRLTESSNTGTGYQVRLRYHVPDGEETRDVESPFAIKLTYDREAVQVDDQISATATIANRTDDIAPMIMVDLPIPGGFEIVSDDLERLKQDGVIERYDRTQRQAILYLINLKPNQKLQFQYRLRATMPVRVAVPGAQVWEYYAPDRRARTTSTRFEVGDI